MANELAALELPAQAVRGLLELTLDVIVLLVGVEALDPAAVDHVEVLLAHLVQEG